jgi:hypothetical protein
MKLLKFGKYLLVISTSWSGILYIGQNKFHPLLIGTLTISLMLITIGSLSYLIKNKFKDIDLLKSTIFDVLQTLFGAIIVLIILAFLAHIIGPIPIDEDELKRSIYEDIPYPH